MKGDVTQEGIECARAILRALLDTTAGPAEFPTETVDGITYPPIRLSAHSTTKVFHGCIHGALSALDELEARLIVEEYRRF